MQKNKNRNQHYLTQERWINVHVGAKRYKSNKVTNTSLNCVWKRHSVVFIVGPPVVWKEGYYLPRYGKSTEGQDSRIFGISRFRQKKNQPNYLGYFERMRTTFFELG